MIDPRTSTELTPERLRAIKAGRDPRNEASHTQGIRQGGASGTPYRPRVLHANPHTFSQRWSYAVARIYRIGEGANASSFGRATDTSEMPKLAKEYLELYAYYMTRARPAPLFGIDHNPFRHLSDKDAARMFERRVEGICDKSTGKLGPWYTK